MRVIMSLSGGDRSSVQLKLLFGMKEKGLTDLPFSRFIGIRLTCVACLTLEAVFVYEQAKTRKVLAMHLLALF